MIICVQVAVVRETVPHTWFCHTGALGHHETSVYRRIFSSRYDSATPLLIDLHQATAPELSIQSVQFCSSFIQISAQKQAPSYLADDCHLPADCRIHRSLRFASPSFTLNICRSLLSSYGDPVFSVTVVRIWNFLPQHSTSLTVFRSRVEALLYPSPRPLLSTST